MSNQLWRALVIIGTIFPFAMVGYKLFEEESLLTAVSYTVVIVILFATVIAAWRVKPRSSDTPAARDGRETRAN
jgi:spore maturation protein SpmA